MKLFLDFGPRSVFHGRFPGDPHPRWWTQALELFVISDEAARGVGFSPLSNPNDLLWFEKSHYKQMLDQFRSSDGKGQSKDFTGTRSWKGFKTLSAAREDVVCVLPKARTTAVGCTMRSLSHHLSLLPSQGVARGRWHPAAQDEKRSSSSRDELNILLVPFPFSIPDTAFTGKMSNPNKSRGWGFFKIKQTWLEQSDSPLNVAMQLDNMSSFVSDLATTATSVHGANSIDAIIFPELALNHELFIGLRDRLKSRLPSLEILIAGLSDDGNERKGNFVATTMLPRGPDQDISYSAVREKHHRWKLDRHQLESYGLLGALNPKAEWWESLDLLSRRVDFACFRDQSVLAAMICEDLARVDPCHELLRAVGPNLIVALLMDAPQFTFRWPARYATVLAEDPGSAVLTLTSRGLMTRQHLIGSGKSKKDEDRVVALWRDDFHGQPIQIACPNNSHGVWLKLWNSPTTDVTLDGREDRHGHSWYYGQHKPLQLKDPDGAYRDIIGPQDRELRNETSDDKPKT